MAMGILLHSFIVWQKLIYCDSPFMCCKHIGWLSIINSPQLLRLWWRTAWSAAWWMYEKRMLWIQFCWLAGLMGKYCLVLIYFNLLNRHIVDLQIDEISLINGSNNAHSLWLNIVINCFVKSWRFKKCDPHIFDNYRPISPLSSISKTFEKVVFNQVYAYFTNNDLFYTSQYGFRNLHSTEYASLEMVDRISQYLDDGRLSITAYLDLSKAFDAINHENLLKKLNIMALQTPHWNGLKATCMIDNTMYFSMDAAQRPKRWKRVLKQVKCGLLFIDLSYVQRLYICLFLLLKKTPISSSNPTHYSLLTDYHVPGLLWYPYPDTLIVMAWYFSGMKCWLVSLVYIHTGGSLLFVCISSKDAKCFLIRFNYV